MSEPRRRLSPDDRRNELLALGAEVFGQRPYDEVRIDEIAERAGVSRALMYHYFPDKRAFFAAVVRAEGERLFEATNTPPEPGQSLFDQVRAGVLAYLRLRRGTSARRVGGLHGHGPLRPGAARHRRHRQRPPGQPDHGANHRGRRRPARLQGRTRPAGHASTAGWRSHSRLCRQRIMDPSIDADYVADACAHALLDAVVPAITERPRRAGRGGRRPSRH